MNVNNDVYFAKRRLVIPGVNIIIFLIFNQVNETRHLWSGRFHCGVKDKDFVSIIALTCFFCFLPIVFYVGAKLHADVKERKCKLIFFLYFVIEMSDKCHTIECPKKKTILLIIDIWKMYFFNYLQADLKEESLT